MSTQNSALNTKGVNTESKNAVKNASTTQRVVVTRNEYDVVFDHAVRLVVAYSLGQKVEKPREGFAFGPIANGNHTRNYAKSLIWGFATSKAGKVLKDFDDVAVKANREKIAIAILTDCNLVKGDSKAIAASLNRVEPKRERVFAESVLSELTKPTEPTTKGGKPKAKSQPKKAEKTTTKGGKKSAKPAAHKGSEAQESKPYRLTKEQKKIAKQFFEDWVKRAKAEGKVPDVDVDIYELLGIGVEMGTPESVQDYLGVLYDKAFEKAFGKIGGTWTVGDQIK